MPTEAMRKLGVGQPGAPYRGLLMAQLYAVTAGLRPVWCAEDAATGSSCRLGAASVGLAGFRPRLEGFFGPKAGSPGMGLNLVWRGFGGLKLGVAGVSWVKGPRSTGHAAA